MRNPFRNILSSGSRKGAARSSGDATPLWIGATVVFALLFFLSSVLDMKVKFTFGQSSATPTTTGSYQTAPLNAAPAGGIASQVGGC